MWWWSLLVESSFRNGRSGEVSCTKYSFHWPAKLGFVRLSHIQCIVHEFIAIMHACTFTCSTCTCTAIRILLQYHSYMYVYMYTPHLSHQHCKHDVRVSVTCTVVTFISVSHLNTVEVTLQSGLLVWWVI